MRSSVIMSMTKSPLFPELIIDSQLLEILRCPVTHSRLTLADAETLDSLNQGIAAGSVQSRVMETLDTPLEAGLVNENHSFLMPIYQGIPDMNPDDIIALDQL